jgi:hypothetical protein
VIPEQLNERHELAWHEAQDNVTQSDTKIDTRTEMGIDRFVCGTFASGGCFGVDSIKEMA